MSGEFAILASSPLMQPMIGPGVPADR
jgi:hypothetical protein